ncbi:cupin domain-containing protein [Nocardia tenerifensis]|uniref:cupin domain-containing protein n=1 Tax=Nocardia tenerifensis TaxID=228006 RepID=UPI003571245D
MDLCGPRGDQVVADGEEVTLSTGDSYYCPSGVRHRWWAHADDTTTLLLAVADERTIRRAPHAPRRTGPALPSSPKPLSHNANEPPTGQR